MAKIYKSVEELIGNTPLLELTKIEKGTGATLLAKVEALNPGGSAKDRIAKRMVEDAEKAGRRAQPSLSPQAATQALVWH